MKNFSVKGIAALLIIALCFGFASCEERKPETTADDSASILSRVPKYTGKASVEIDDNYPDFSGSDKNSRKAFEKYSRLDKLGRCGVAYANVCTDTMPTKKRESISSVKPSGWNQKYYAILEDGYLYNRCHLIGYQLTAENSNKRNLITGTRYLNVNGMLPYEEKVARYVAATENHVLYRVKPVFDGDNLVASGVEMEAWSVEDNGDGICFDVFCYNVQPGIAINYADGSSRRDSGTKSSSSKVSSKTSAKTYTYILNNNTKKFHRTDCALAKNISAKNKETYRGKRSDLIKRGYSPCRDCKP